VLVVLLDQNVANCNMWFLHSSLRCSLVLKPLLVVVVPTMNTNGIGLFNIDSVKRNLTELQIPVLKMSISNSRNRKDMVV
jgi:hypothetical protein